MKGTTQRHMRWYRAWKVNTKNKNRHAAADGRRFDGSERALRRLSTDAGYARDLEQWAAELDKLRDEHRSASVDDALRMSLPINNLPAIDIDEEIARAKENWFKL